MSLKSDEILDQFIADISVKGHWIILYLFVYKIMKYKKRIDYYNMIVFYKHTTHLITSSSSFHEN